MEDIKNQIFWKEYAYYLKGLIKSNRIDEAFSKIEEVLDCNSYQYNEFVQLKSRFSKLQKDIRSNLIDYSSENISNNNLISAILNFVDFLQISDLKNIEKRKKEERDSINNFIQEKVEFIEHRRSDAETYYRLGNMEYAYGEIEKAVEMYEKATQIDEQWYKPFAALSIVFEEKGEISKSFEYRDISNSLHPDRNALAATYSNMACVQTVRGNYEEALKIYLQILKFEPDYLHIYVNIANIYRILDNKERELDFLRLYKVKSEKILGEQKEDEQITIRIKELET